MLPFCLFLTAICHWRRLHVYRSLSLTAGLLVCLLVGQFLHTTNVHDLVARRAGRGQHVLDHGATESQGRATREAAALSELSFPDEARAPSYARSMQELQQDYLARYLSDRYKAPELVTARAVSAAYANGQQNGLDPLLLLAVMAVESRFDPLAHSSAGAQGIMQIMTRVHAAKFEAAGGLQAAFYPEVNIQIGTQILQDCLKRGKSLRNGLQLYNGSWHSGYRYSTKVLGTRASLLYESRIFAEEFPRTLGQESGVLLALTEGGTVYPHHGGLNSGRTMYQSIPDA